LLDFEFIFSKQDINNKDLSLWKSVFGE